MSIVESDGPPSWSLDASETAIIAILLAHEHLIWVALPLPPIQCYFQTVKAPIRKEIGQIVLSNIEWGKGGVWANDFDSDCGWSTKCPWVGEMGLKARGWGSGKIFSRPPCSPPPLPTGNLYPRQFRKRQETKMAARRTQRPTSAGSHGKIGDCEQSIDRRTVCKKTLLETWFSLRSCAKPEHQTRSLTFLETNHF